MNIYTKERRVVGPSVKAMAQEHGLCANELYLLINGRQLAYRGWVKAIGYDYAQGAIAEEFL